MISKSTAARIYSAYAEIERAHILLQDLEASPTVPLFGVRPDLAKSVIRAHLAEKTCDLIEANESARIELEPKCICDFELSRDPHPECPKCNPIQIKVAKLRA